MDWSFQFKSSVCWTKANSKLKHANDVICSCHSIELKRLILRSTTTYFCWSDVFFGCVFITLLTTTPVKITGIDWVSRFVVEFSAEHIRITEWTRFEVRVRRNVVEGWKLNKLGTRERTSNLHYFHLLGVAKISGKRWFSEKQYKEIEIKMVIISYSVVRALRLSCKVDVNVHAIRF